jgi:hemin uptake protein HemP
MDLAQTAARTAEASPGSPGLDIPVADSTDLLKGQRELRIRHGSNTYRLRLTASDKLILTK